ncbi:hypothetical protein C4559_04840 [Candidatus Microgenomates bacterium]|nr:MAG: hypothetical protein C4559_04840 [Candidatus Microgenomates bacterium]
MSEKLTPRNLAEAELNYYLDEGAFDHSAFYFCTKALASILTNKGRTSLEDPNNRLVFSVNGPQIFETDNNGSVIIIVKGAKKQSRIEITYPANNPNIKKAMIDGSETLPEFLKATINGKPKEGLKDLFKHMANLAGIEIKPKEITYKKVFDKKT